MPNWGVGDLVVRCDEHGGALGGIYEVIHVSPLFTRVRLPDGGECSLFHKRFELHSSCRAPVKIVRLLNEGINTLQAIRELAESMGYDDVLELLDKNRGEYETQNLRRVDDPRTVDPCPGRL